MGRMGLKRLSPRAMPALIISANLPDIDSFVAPLIGQQPIEFHRGFTHGIGGLILMPFVAMAIIIGWEKLRPGKDGPLKLAGLFVACFLGTLSHPILDFMNTYGVQLLAPAGHHWFHADVLFIMDPWIWIMLIIGLEYSWRAERLGRNWTRPAQWAFAAMLGYIVLNAAISWRAEALARPLVASVAEPRMIVAGEVPLEFWKRKLVWRSDAIGGNGSYEPLKGINHATLDPLIYPLNLGDPRLAAAARSDSHVRGFLAWSWMPMVVQQNGRAFLTDQRFYDAGRRAPISTFLIPLDNGLPSS